MEMIPIKKMPIEIIKAKDGDVVEYKGTDVVKLGDACVKLSDLLMWDGLEKLMRNGKQIDPEMVHTFSGGVYIREMHLKAGTFIIGKRHRHETCNILMRGELSVYIGDNKPVAKITGPTIITSEPMVRKIAYIHEDAVFLNIHPTKETDLEKIEDEFIITEDEYLQLKGPEKCLGVQ